MVNGGPKQSNPKRNLCGFETSFAQRCARQSWWHPRLLGGGWSRPFTVLYDRPSIASVAAGNQRRVPAKQPVGGFSGSSVQFSLLSTAKPLKRVTVIWDEPAWSAEEKRGP